jgi:hypothetical protein
MSSTALSAITARIAVIARAYDVATLDTYIGSDRFLELFGELPPQRRPSVFAAYQTARESCLRRKPIAAPGSIKVDWKKPGAVDRFKTLWLKHGGNAEMIAREMPMTPGAVGMAYSRFIRHGATVTCGPHEKASRKPQDGRSVSRLPMAPPSAKPVVAPSIAAA